MSDTQLPSKELVLVALRDGDRCRNYGPDRTENEAAIVVLADEVERLQREKAESDRCLNHYQVRFSLITDAWRSGDNSAVLDAVRKHITAKDCEDADRIARASLEPPAECHHRDDLMDAELLGLAGEYDQSDGAGDYRLDAQAMLKLLRAVADRSAPPPPSGPFTVEKYGSLAAAITAERDWLRTQVPPLPVAHGVIYDRGGWVCSICHGWNCLKVKHCAHSHSGSTATKPGEQA